MSNNKGYTLVELLLSIGIMTVLLSVGGLTFANIRSEYNIDYLAGQAKIELIRAQRATGNGTPTGIYFDANRYVYFTGASYSEGAAGNEETLLPGSYGFTNITFPSNIAQFDNVTGYPLSYDNPAQAVLVENASGKSRTIQVNQWGVIEVQ